MSYDQQGRFMVITLDKTTGTHRLHSCIPTKSYSGCIAICQSMGPVQQAQHRLVLQAHKDSGEPA